MLEFFSKWQRDLREPTLGLTGPEQTAAFLPPECWNDLQQACVGFLGLCMHWIPKGVTVYGRTLNQDIVERA